MPVTANDWKNHTVELDLRGSTAGRFELVTRAGVWVRAFTVQDPAPPTGRVLNRLDASKLQPFVQRARKHQEPGSKVPISIVAESGPGKMPPNWYRWISYPETIAEYFADGPPGAVALGARAVEGPGGVQINTPEFEVSGDRCTLRILYQTGPASPGFVVRLRPMKPTMATIRDLATLPPTGGSWRMAQIDVEMQGSTSALFELYNGVAGTDAAFRIREYFVIEPD